MRVPASWTFFAAAVAPSSPRAVAAAGGRTWKRGRGKKALRSSATRMAIDIPRITLPDSLDSTFSDLGLNNPNKLSQDEYNTYSGAAIAGTLFVFVPAAFLVFKPVGFLYDFLFSALLGGGLGAFLALKKDPVSKTANEIGGSLLAAVEGVRGA